MARTLSQSNKTKPATYAAERAKKAQKSRSVLEKKRAAHLALIQVPSRSSVSDNEDEDTISDVDRLRGKYKSKFISREPVRTQVTCREASPC